MVFRQGRGCVDKVLTIMQLSEKVLQKNKQIVTACLDFMNPLGAKTPDLFVIFVIKCWPALPRIIRDESS